MDFVSKNQLIIALTRVKTWILENFLSNITLDGLTIKTTRNGNTTNVGTIPSADGSNAGVSKLYDNVTGNNTDGAPSQNAVKNALALKADKNGSTSEDFTAKSFKVYGEDTSGNPTATVKLGQSFNGGSNGTLYLPSRTGTLLVDGNVDDAMSSSSTNPVQNKVVNTALGTKADKNGSPSEDFNAKDITLNGNNASIKKVHNSLAQTFTLILPNKNDTLATLSDLETLNPNVFEPVAVLPTASASTMGKIYLVPSPNSRTGNTKDEYVTIRSGAGTEQSPYTYDWEKIGSTETDLSHYWQNSDSTSASNYLVQSTLGAQTDTASASDSASLWANLKYYFPIASDSE